MHARVRVSRITGASDYSSLSLRSLVALAHAPTLATTEQGLAGPEFRLVRFKANFFFRFSFPGLIHLCSNNL
jgi:hypothetical protein